MSTLTRREKWGMALMGVVLVVGLPYLYVRGGPERATEKQRRAIEDAQTAEDVRVLSK